MAYVTVANLRPDTAAEYAQGVTLTAAEASDARLTAAIAAISERLDRLTNDHFETQTGVTLEVDVTDHTGRLALPRRTTAVTTVKTRDELGVLTTQASTTYRFRSSLDAAGATRIGESDYLDIIPEGVGLTLTPWAWSWPYGTQTVQVLGTFGWTVTPRDIKRAVAVLAFDHFKEQRGDLGRAVRYTTGEIAVERSVPDADHPTGLLEVDAIVTDYHRYAGAMVG